MLSHSVTRSPSGFQSTNRPNPLAQKILASDIKLGLNDSFTFYTADNCSYYPTDLSVYVLINSSLVAFLNNVPMPADHNYNNPSVPFTVNGVVDHNSQRFFVRCTQSRTWRYRILTGS